MTRPEIPPDMAAPDFDEDEIQSRLFLGCAAVVFTVAVIVGAIILLAWRGWKCGVL